MDDDQLLRYSRQIMLPEFDAEGQEKILNAHVAVVGVGGLGSPVAMYLAAAGVGQLTFFDHDVVDATNFQRQILHEESSLGSSKVRSAKQTLGRINSQTVVSIVEDRFSPSSAADLVGKVDVIVDGTDNFESRRIINEFCLKHLIPWISGAAIRMEGQIVVFDPRRKDSPCYGCLYSEEPSESTSCAENGVLAPIVGVVGSLQANETLKLICGLADGSVGWVLYLDLRRLDWRKLKLRRDLACSVCGAQGRSSQKSSGNSE